jgi:SAM-dependent methyltransferase
MAAHRRARRALARQRSYQATIAQEVRGRENDVMAVMQQRSGRVRELLDKAGPLSGQSRVLEIGSGSHGLIFSWETGGLRVGVDPLAVDYNSLFPAWQRRVPRCAAIGEALPFRDGTFALVLSDNVIDHAEQPAEILREAVRVLQPGGRLFFSVNVHHPVYDVASSLYGVWQAAGIPLEVGPFADHTVHFTLAAARRLLAALPLRIVWEDDGIAAAHRAARTVVARHMGDRLKRVFFKNARFEAVAVRTGGRVDSETLDAHATGEGA